MAKSLPVKTADTDYGLMFWGPSGPESIDDGNEFTLNTASNHSIRLCESGHAVSVTPKCHTERVGYSLDPKKEDGKEAPAKQILADNGDIILSAKNGNIHLSAKNIFIHAQGADPDGSIVVNGNGFVNITSGEQTRIMGSKLCLKGVADVDITGGAINIKGKITYGSNMSAIGSLKSLVNGDFAALLEGIDKACS